MKISPENPEAWFDLAGVQALQNKQADALTALTESLRRSLERRKRDTNAVDLAKNAMTDARFNALRQLPDFQKQIGQLLK